MHLSLYYGQIVRRLGKRHKRNLLNSLKKTMSSPYDLVEEDFIHETLLSTSNIQDDNNKFLKKNMNSTYDLVEEDFIHETQISTSNIQDDGNNFLKKT
jgi:hypoxanthine phosphoribosyltransferase